MFDYVKFSESYLKYLNSFKRYITHSMKRRVLEEISLIKHRGIEVIRENAPGIELLLNNPDPDPDPNNDDRTTNRDTLLNDQELLEFQVEVRDVLERFYPIIISHQMQKSSAGALVCTARVPEWMYDMWQLDL